MAIQFRKSIKVFPGVRLNIGKKSASVTLGGKHTPHVTYSTTGRRTTSVRIGSGLSRRKTSKRRR
ncbi:MAG: hypothetical protein JWO67_6688 [Streptosporangiaceae bacterium]|nr:hypothetical protein [Streptosporangiaceae bacterium]